MKQRKQLSIDNFGLGLNRDGAMSRDKMQSLRVMKNYKIIYTDGRLQIRPGYERWNDTELDTPATQLFWFADLEGNENLLGIQGDTKQWNAIKESGAHVLLDGFIATARRPIAQFAGRVFYGANDVGTGAAWRWTDNDSLDGGVAPYSFRAGIKKPTDIAEVAAVTGEGNIIGVIYPGAGTSSKWDITNTNRQKIAAQFSVATTQKVWGIDILWMWYVVAAKTGMIRFSIRVDDGGEPGDLVDNDSIGSWLPVKSGTVGSYVESYVSLQDSVELIGGTDYWLVIEASDDYYSNYNAGGAAESWFFVAFGYSVAGASDALRWDGSNWIVSTAKLGFTVGGLSDDTYFDYCLTYYNSTYGIESRRGDASQRIKRNTFVRNAITVTFTEPTSVLQADQVRIYRREIGSDPDIAESAITDTYKLVASVDKDTSPVRDNHDSTTLGGILQTDNHYCVDDVSDGDDDIRQTALVPYIAVLWKGRIWFVEEDGNILHFSKKLEEDGATGLPGDLIPDFFPLDNQLEIASSSKILALRILPADELAVYTNSDIWVVSGADDNRNPPADMSPKKMIADIGIVAPAALGFTKNQQVFLAREGLYAYKGTLSREYLSANIQSIFDDIEDQYIDDSIIATLGDEVWLLVDDDNDGNLESIYILDLQRKPVTWRVYDYGVNLNDIVARTTGTEYKTLLAADADNNYVLQLDTGTDDNGVPIVAELETQDIRIPKKASVYMVELDAYYPNVPSVYEITVRDHVGLEKSYMIQPNGADDIAGHRTGCLLSATPTMRIKIVQRSVNEDQLLGFKIGYVTK